MLDITIEGRHYVVFSKSQGNRFQLSFRTWEEVEKYVAGEKGVYKIVSIDAHDVPLTGIKEKTTFHVQV